jgi:hypothetical protein
MILPAITLYQPWATWIMRGWKSIETRTHNRFACLKDKTILIHAGLTTDSSIAATHNPYLTFEQIKLNPDDMINGFILGSAYVRDYGNLVHCHSQNALIECGGLTKRYGLFLNQITIFEKPIPVQGGMGIWHFDMQTQQKVKKPKPQTAEIEALTQKTVNAYIKVKEHFKKTGDNPGRLPCECGGELRYTVAMSNGHIWTKCNKCGIYFNE